MNDKNTLQFGLKYFRDCARADAKMKSHFANILGELSIVRTYSLPRHVSIASEGLTYPATAHFQLKFVHR